MPFLQSQLIEAFRWAGAMVVLLLHTTNLFVGLGDIATAPHAALVHVWWFFSGVQFAHQAVVGFFVISGYLVGGETLLRLRGHPGGLPDYYIHRFSRIYVVLVPALLLTLVLDQCGAWLFAGSSIYDDPVLRGGLRASSFLASLLNAQGIFSDLFGTNGPLWSLACEFWYYMLFPLLLSPFAFRSAGWRRFLWFGAGASLCFAFVRQPGYFGFGFILWSMGAFARLAPRAPIRSPALALGLYLGATVVIRLLVRGEWLAGRPWLGDAADLADAALFVAALLAFRDGPRQGYPLLRSGVHQRLAAFSFSLYAIHMPILVFARAGAEATIGESWVRQMAQPANYLLAVAVMSAAVLASWCFSRQTEARTRALRRTLRTALDKLVGQGREAPAKSC